MIILDREAGLGTKEDRYEGLTLRHPSAAFTRSSSLLLPDYNTSEALHWKSISPSPTPPPPRRPRVDPRIWKAAIYALAIYIFLSIVIIIPVAVIKSKKHNNDHYRDGPENSFWDDIEDADSPAPLFQLSTSGPTGTDLNKTCNIWVSPPSSTMAQARFSLLPNGLITIHSNATYDSTKPPFMDGNLDIRMNSDVKEKSVVFNLDMTYSSSDLLNQTDVCFSNTGSNRGLSIFVPTQLNLDDWLGLNISVLLPQVKSTVDIFAVYLPMLSQTFGNLSPSITFNTITMESAARPIVIQSLQAQEISIKNVAASIVGSFNVTTSLTLDNVKGPVTSNITLTQPAYPMGPTLLKIESGDDQISADVMLDSSLLEAQPKSPAFQMQVRNFNGPMNLSFAYAENMPNTTMLLQATNNLAPTVVTLDSHYQGTFSVQTKMDQVNLHDHATDADDPTGAQRPRTLQYSQVASDTVSGWAGWGMRPMKATKQSGIEILSALSPVLLNFGSS